MLRLFCLEPKKPCMKTIGKLASVSADFLGGSCSLYARGRILRAVEVEKARQLMRPWPRRRRGVIMMRNQAQSHKRS
jgi:hypothetical protein